MWRFAIRNLWSRPIRSTLSILGLTVAIVGMIALFAVAEGLDATVNKTFRIIPGLVVMQPGAPIPIFSRLPTRWGDEIREIPGVHAYCAEVWARANVIEGKNILSPPRMLLGTDIPGREEMDYAVYREHVVEGRFFELSDQHTNHTVISRPIAEQFHKTLGDTIEVNGRELKIIGIYACGSLILDVTIIVDVHFARDMLRMSADDTSNFYVETDPGVDQSQVVQLIEDRFRGRVDTARSAPLMVLWGLSQGMPALPLWPSTLGSLASPTREQPPQTPENPSETAPGRKRSSVEVRGAEDWADQFQKLSADLDVFLFLLTSVGVTIAVLSIVNTMLMSVTERLIEFGILKANGWSNHDVLKLVTLESAALGICGGLMGSAFGWVVVQIVNANWPNQVHLEAGPRLLLFGVVFSATLGVLGGLYPAWWASRMVPMDAIRRG